MRAEEANDVNATAGNLRSLGENHLDAIEERIRPLPAARLGALLQQLREDRGLQLRDIALVPELRSELEAIEAGILRPDASQVQVLLRCYNAQLDDLVPPRDTLVVTDGTDHEVLARYLVAVRRERRTAKHPLLREGDIRVLAGILGADPGDIQQRLHKHAIEERIADLSTPRLTALVRQLRASAVFPDQVAAPSAALESQLEEVESGRLRPDAEHIGGAAQLLRGRSRHSRASSSNARRQWDHR